MQGVMEDYHGSEQGVELQGCAPWTQFGTLVYHHLVAFFFHMSNLDNWPCDFNTFNRTNKMYYSHSEYYRRTF